MTTQILRIAILLAIFGSLSCSMEQEFGSAKIGEKCERDRNCIEHSFCRAQMNCFCDPYYSPTLDKSMCIATSGLSCTNHSTCSSMANAECRQGVCACKETFILDINNSSNCISRPSAVGDRCQRNDECQEAFDRAMCINEICQCFTGHHFVNVTGQCVQTRLLYNFCTMDYECLDKDNPDALVCKNGECVCKDGELTCSKGSLHASVGIPLIILCLLQRLI